MEKYKKKDMLEAVNLLFHVNDSVLKNAKANKKEDIIEALSQCQDVALALGNYLESLGEAGENFVHILEDYCENLYQMSLIFSNENLCRKLSKKIKKQLSSLKTGISLELPADKIEMVFLPYKVSMWDSLESVWRAASEDPECEAYVMPIPYYERNAKGEFAIEHYEGNQFPEDVPVVNYQDYDLMERKPDVVFIHNPYDQYNYVTSIHPSYYIPELKKCGCKVVYIPYYISAEVNPDSIEVQKGREGYIVTPGVLYSDMVFVQSENVKRLFVNVLEKQVSDVGRRYWEERIFGLGSPKLDRVHNVKRNDTLLPEKWKMLIYTEDGIRKKVIFYNISIGALLNTHGMLDKIVDVLCFFKENTDVTLWWRSHPLYESTLASMRPDLLEKYRKIVNKYREEEWGIFDEGVDLEWAIAETDAYYGDASSVVQLYKEVRKPVMIQNVLVKAKQSMSAKDIPIWPSAFYVDEDDIWFVHGMMNILMRYNIDEDYTYIINRIPNESLFQEHAYAGIYKYGSRIFLIPIWAKEIAVYYIKENIFRKIPIPYFEDGKGKFINTYISGKYIYCIPFWCDSVVKIDMENENIVYINIGKTKGTYINGTTKMGNEIISVCAHTNQTIIFDLDSETVLLKEFGNSNRHYTDITNINNQIYLFDECTGTIFKFDRKNNRELKFYRCPYKEIRMTSLFSQQLILDSVEGCGIQIINDKGEKMWELDESEGINHESLHSVFCSGIEENCVVGSNIMSYFSRDTYCMYQFTREKLIKSFCMKLKEKELSKLCNILMIIEDTENTENLILDLKTWLNSLIIAEIKGRTDQYSSGDKILQVIKKALNGITNISER